PIEEEVVGIEFVVPEKFIDRPMELVAAGLDRQVHHRAPSAAKLGRKVVRLDPEFLRGVDRRRISEAIEADRVDGRAIDEHYVGACYSSIRREIAPGLEIHRCRIVPEAGLNGNPRRQGYEGQRIAPVHWKLGYLAVLDNLPQR